MQSRTFSGKLDNVVGLFFRKSDNPGELFSKKSGKAPEGSDGKLSVRTPVFSRNVWKLHQTFLEINRKHGRTVLWQILVDDQDNFSSKCLIIPGIPCFQIKETEHGCNPKDKDCRHIPVQQIERAGERD